MSSVKGKFVGSNDEYKKLRVLIRKRAKYVADRLFDDYVSGPISTKIIPFCIICGSEENITDEHVLPRWVFENDSSRSFTIDVNQLPKRYIGATVPACLHCNSVILNDIERDIQKTLSLVDLQRRYYTTDEWDNVIRWLEIIDYKFQVFDMITKFLAHRKMGFIPAIANYPIAVIRDLSEFSVKSKCRHALKRISRKDKNARAQSLMVGRTIQKSFHYFHTSGQFIHLEIPTYNKAFFYFFKREFDDDEIMRKEALDIIGYVYGSDMIAP
ncbi:hypothetical protein ACN9ML_30540 [Dyadobacter endophyticus]|uniref:hypothetical protein n=1 Tax=Dyadobacter endophyticus TaxID=1749036 RepID=UPI003CF5BEB5